MFPPGIGGSERYGYEIANALGARGHDVDVFTQSKSENIDMVELNENVTLSYITRARRQLVTFETLYYSLKARFGIDIDDYDVVHGTLMPASTIALSDRIGIDTPIVLTSHSFALSEVFAHSPEKLADYFLKFVFHPINVVFDNLAARSADHIISISQEMEKQLTERYHLSPQKITTIPHGVDTNQFEMSDECHPEVSDNKLTLLFVGRLVSRKGVDLAIDALAASQEEEVELLIAGTGRLETDLKQQVAALGIEDHVNFLGYVPEEDLPLLYSSADATLFMSNYEGFGLVFLESMAAGTPVIGPPVGGIPDLIEDGVSGFITERTVSSVSNCIDELSRDKNRLKSMSDAALEAAEYRDWNYIAGEVEKVYQNVLNE